MNRSDRQQIWKPPHYNEAINILSGECNSSLAGLLGKNY